MILDTRNLFGQALALNTGAAGSYLIGDVADLSVARDIGWDDDSLWWVTQIQTTATSGGSATLQLNLVTDSAANLGSAVVLMSSPAIAVASLTAGTIFYAAKLPTDGVNTWKRYLGIQQVTGTAAFTAGKITSFLADQFWKLKLYQDAIN